MTESDRPNILFLAHRVPYPPDKGDRIRTFHILKHLSRRAAIHVACLADEPVGEETLAALQKCCAQVAVVPLPPRARWMRALAYLARGRTLTEGAFYSPVLVKTLRAWAAATSFRAVFASSSGMAQFARLRELAGSPVVVDLVDVDSEKWFDYAATSNRLHALLYRTEGRRLRRLERSLAASARALTLVSNGEADIFHGFCPLGDVQVITNGVDFNYFHPLTEPVVEDGCVFVGALDYLPNVDAACWFAREAWPEIRRRHPDARLSLVGRRPTVEVGRLGGLPGVGVVGQVPDVRPHVARAAVAVAPLRIARGLQNKVLEALAMGKAVVASPQALAGLQERLDVPALCATSSEEWVEQVGKLLGDTELRRSLGELGRRYVTTHHDWAKCLRPFEPLLGLSADERDMRHPAGAEPAMPARGG
jgi:sugar transferase (PEP-CTERM/EpsH1 system associated)